MRVLIQRVKHASVDIIEPDRIWRSGEINAGLLVFIGIENSDGQQDIDWLVSKIANLRVFEDSFGKMNLSILDKNYQVLLVSQFTLYANLKKGNRPSFNGAGEPDFSRVMYEKFAAALQNAVSQKVPCGVFGAMMDVSLINDGPVTIFIDSKNRDF